MESDLILKVKNECKCGGLLTAALVAIPASSSRNFSRNLTQYSFYAMTIGMISSFIGILLHEITGISAGPLVILANTLVFLVSIIFRR